MRQVAKRVTSADVAKEAGVSRTTVSFVLNDRPGHAIPEETRERVLEAARRLKYRPHASARALAAGHSDIVLLALPDMPIGDGVSRFAEELAAALADRGLTLVAHAGADDRSLQDVCAAVDASAVIGLGAFDQATVQALRAAGVKVVIPSDGNAPSMRHVGRLQAEHLIARGHRRLGYAMPTHPSHLPMARHRLQGVTDACAAASLRHPVVIDVELEVVAAERAVRQWTSHSVTGVCAFNDETALAVLAGARVAGVEVPRGLAVVGADDIPTAALSLPPLTTVSFDLREAGRQRAEAVASTLAGRAPAPGAAPVGPELIGRASS
ncbi:LacI family DNA-binding transcriptional regulator [Streptomyces sp. NPDC006385]|uniref:LacI family DNA-binding transcriptional regulator n=1 Tax=Streptomyces sp. NPDC006385 TaxID=3156761 RepID=UPI0033A771D7